MKHTKLGGKKKKTHLFKLAQKARPARHVEYALPTHMQAVCRRRVAKPVELRRRGYDGHDSSCEGEV